MPDLATSLDSTSTPATRPDYIELVRFLIRPFLESPDSLKVDCELSQQRSRVLIRLAFDGEDRGRVFGRGGRNIQAVRAVLQAVGQSAGHTVHLDIYGGQPSYRDDDHAEGRPSSRPPARRPRSRKD